ncbi:leucine-rich repeat-containing protein 74A-like isoform X2 [Mugil cephalus]|uniref:leucine-rich repeat-containing protein 74A-like isoform X2 n=1 Tax=Mugil cephalus TaxID=48193 RepID=UPI001FB5E1A8|nr:leucine-rich repeat-containing protein 74A-like isoform X2 [Mugil cephalus]
MHESHEDFQSGEEQQKEKQLADDQSGLLSTGSLDPMEDLEKLTQAQEGDSGDEWDTDLEDNATRHRRSSSLSELYLQACKKIGVTPVSSFLRHLGESAANLNHCGVGPLGAKALAIVLQNDNVITHLELEDNTLQADGTRYLMKMLRANVTIQSLNISENHLGHQGAYIISKILLDNYCIKSIKLSGNDFDHSAAKYLADALMDDYVIKELDLSHNKLCDIGGEYLGRMLARNQGIEVLDLSWNHFRVHGALSAGLKVNSILKQFHLSHNDFGHIGAESLGQALKQNNTLVLLDLSNNWLDDEAVTLLCQGLSTNGTLKVLNLANNPMTNTGALVLLKTVKNNTRSAMEKIDISRVFVRETFVELLEETRQTRPALEVQYDVMNSVTRNLSAIHIFKKHLEEQNQSITDFFRDLDKEETTKVSSSAFRKAAKEANIPLDQRQIEWLITRFDKNCTAGINYSQFDELS